MQSPVVTSGSKFYFRFSKKSNKAVTKRYQIVIFVRICYVIVKDMYNQFIYLCINLSIYLSILSHIGIGKHPAFDIPLNNNVPGFDQFH